MRAHRLKPTINTFLSENVHAQHLEILSPKDWKLIEYMIQIGSVFLWLTNASSIGELALGNIPSYFKYMRYTILKFQSLVQGQNTRWGDQLYDRLCAMEKKLQKYIDIMLQDEEVYNVSLLLIPPTLGKEDFRWSSPHTLWTDLPTDNYEAKAAIQARCEKSFINLYTLIYHEPSISQSRSPTDSNSFDINCHIESIAQRLSPQKQVSLLLFVLIFILM
jgi:hypothetical protein